MGTKNPRVVGYVSPENHAKLKEFMTYRDLTESKAINVVLSEFFGTATSTLSGIPGRTLDDVLERIAALEAEMAHALGESAA